MCQRIMEETSNYCHVSENLLDYSNPGMESCAFNDALDVNRLIYCDLDRYQVQFSSLFVEQNLKES